MTPAVEARETLDWKAGATARTSQGRHLFEMIETVDELGLVYLGGFALQPVSATIAKTFDHRLSDEEIRQIRSKLTLHGVTMLTYAIPEIPQTDAECRAVFEFAKKMGIECVVSSANPKDLERIERHCEKYGIRFALERNESEASTDSSYLKHLKKTLQGRGSQIGVALNLALAINAGTMPEETLDTLAGRLFTLRIPDLSGEEKAGSDTANSPHTATAKEFLEALKERDVRPVMFDFDFLRQSDSLDRMEKSIQRFDALSLKLVHD